MPIVRTVTMLLACMGLGGCAAGYQLEVRFEDRAIAEASTRIDLWIVPSCDAVTDDRHPPSDAIAHVVALSGGAADAPGELPREGDFGILARATDDQCRIVAESCDAHRFERGGQGTISITLHAIEPPRGCAGGEQCRDGSCTAVVDAGIDASSADAGPEDAAPSDASSLDGGPADACVAGSATTYRSVVESHRPIAWYRLSDPPGTTVAANEIVGSPAGRYTRAPMVSGSEGAIPGDTDDRALRCYAPLPDGSSMEVDELGDVLTSGSMTVEMWLRRPLDADDTGLQRFIFAENYLEHGWRFYLPSTSRILLASGESGTPASELNAVSVSRRTIPIDARWHHLVLTMEAPEDRAPYVRTTVAIYLDGTAITAGQLFDFVPSPSPEILVDICAGAGVFFFDGDVDELAIYDRPLAPADIASHWSAGRSCG